MDKEDGGIARYSSQCSQGIDWNKSKVVVTERKTKQREIKIQGENTSQQIRSPRRLEVGDL